MCIVYTSRGSNKEGKQIFSQIQIVLANCGLNNENNIMKITDYLLRCYNISRLIGENESVSQEVSLHFRHFTNVHRI